MERFRQKRKQSSRLYEQLEDRLLFDAAAPVDAPLDEAPADVEMDAADVAQQVESTAAADTSVSSAETQPESRKELVIVDPHVDGHEQLVERLLDERGEDSNFEIVLLDAQEDGVSQITDLLAARTDIQSLHLISHGDEGAVRLGSTWLRESNLGVFAAELSMWSNSLTTEADVLIYGCDLAATESGRILTESIAALTGADVASSTDDTGHAGLGGDWELEFEAGSIETEVVAGAATQQEWRGLLAVGPDVTLSLSSDPANPSSAMMGEEITLTATFENTGAPGEVGYGPFIDLVIPRSGADGTDSGGPLDGIDFVSAAYLGTSLTTWELVFPDDDGSGAGTTGTVTHPLGMSGVGTPLQITGEAGDKLVVIQLPFGSFNPEQPEAAVDITLSISDHADVDQVLAIQSRAGFHYGEDAISNPGSDPTVLSAGDASSDSSTWTEAAYIQPSIMTMTKSYLGRENETATGPNHTQQYELALDIADGQTISGLYISDLLPDNIVVTSIDAVTVGGAPAAYTDNLGTLTMPGAAQQLQVSLTSPVTGVTGNDVSVRLTFYVDEFDSVGDRVIPLAGEDDLTGGAPGVIDSRAHNNASASGNWTPIDTRDGGSTLVTVSPAPVDPATGVDHILDAKSIAVQKSVAIVTDVGVGGASPGDTLEYTIEFQISDYYTFGDLVLDDVFQDGQEFDFSFGATLSVEDFAIRAANSGNPLIGNFDVLGLNPGDSDPAGVFTEDLIVDRRLIDTTDDASENPATDGSTSLTFLLSKALQRLGTGEDGILQGGLTAGPLNLGAATGTLRFRTVIQEQFTDTYPSNDRSVDQGDLLTNSSLEISGSVRENAEDGNIANEVLASFREEDTSSASIAIALGALDKQVYAINGDTSRSGNGIQAAPGDVVTYRITYTLPNSDFENLQFTDYLPLPIFDVDDANGDGVGGDSWTFNLSGSFDETAPSAGQVEFGPSDTFFNSQPGSSDTTDTSIPGHEFYAPPQITVDTTANSLELWFGSYDDATSSTSTIDLLFSVTVQNAPFDDGLFLTNVVRSLEGTTNSTPSVFDETVQIELVQPDVQLTKGVVAVDSQTDGGHSFANSAAGTTNSVQRLEYDVPATGGTFTLSWNGNSTGNIAYDATAAQIQTALEALPGLNGNIAVYGGPLDTELVEVEFIEGLAATNVAAITVDASNLSSASDQNERQDILFTVAPTGGTFQLGYEGEQTSSLAWNSSAAAVESALESLTAIDNVTVTIVASGYRVQFEGSQSHLDTSLLTLDSTGLTDHEQQTLTFSGAPTSGSYTLTFNGRTTDAIAFDATATDIQGYLGHLTNIGHSNVLVTSGPGVNQFTVEFVDGLGNLDVPQLTVDDSLLGGASAAVATTRTGSRPAGAVSLVSEGSGAVLNAREIDSQTAPTTGHNEIQRLTASNTPSSGTFTLTFAGQTTSALDHDSTALEIQSALEALSNIDLGDVAVSGQGLPAGEIEIEFTGQYARQDVSLLVVDDTALNSTSDANEIQHLSFTNPPTGGSFRLNFDGQTTGNINYNASAASVESALESLTNIDNVRVQVLGANGYSVEFQGPLAETDVPTLVAIDSGLSGEDEVQQVILDGSVSGGSFTLSLFGDTTSSIAHNESASTIRNRLESLNAIDSGDVSVSRSGDTITIFFQGNLAELSIPELTVNDSSLTGGGATVTTTTDGYRSLLETRTAVTGQRASLSVGVEQESGRAFAFNAPGSSVSFNGQVNSDDLATTPVDADVTGLDAGDTVTFAVVLENIGGADAFDLQVADVLPDGFVIPSGGLNLQVRDGNGDIVNWTGLDTDSEQDLFGTGIDIQDPVSVRLAADDGSDVITFMDSRDDFDPATNERTLGGHGAGSIESLALHPETVVLYGADQDELGWIDQTNGSYTTIGSFGQGYGSEGWQIFDEINGLSFHPTTGELFAIQRTGGGQPDLLFKVDLNSGAAVRDGFGEGIDYITLDTDPVGLGEVDDFAFDANGNVYLSDAVNLLLATIDLDTASSSVSFVGSFGTDIDDMEGLSIDRFGRLWGSTGRNNNPGSNNDKLWEIDKATGTASNPRTLGNGEDYEGLAMLDTSARGVLRDVESDPGSNILIVTYDLTVADDTSPRTATSDLTNSATLKNYAATDGGDDHTIGPDPTDTASATIRSVDMTKTVVSTSQSHTGYENDYERVAVGEIVRFRIVAEVPEGQYSDLIIQDYLPSGLIFLDDGTATAAFVSDTVPDATSGAIDGNESSLHAFGNEYSVNGVTPGYVLPDSAVSNSNNSDIDNYTNGTDVRFKFDDLENLDRDADSEFLVVEFNAIVHNSTSTRNDRNDNRTNNAGLLARDSSNTRAVVATISNSESERRVRVVEPRLTGLTKSANITEIDAGDTVDFTVAFNSSNGESFSTAYDVRVFDDMSSWGDVVVDLSSISLSRNGTLLLEGIDYSNNTAGNVIDLSLDVVDEGDSITLEYSVDVNGDVSLGQSLTSRTEVTYTSLPGDYGSAKSAGNPTGSDLQTLDAYTGSTTDYLSQTGQIHGERDGSGVDFTASSTTQPNDHGLSAEETITVRAPVATKSVTNTSESHTSGADVAIGEVTRYRLEVRLPETTNLPDYVLVDHLPEGMSFLNDGTAAAAFVSSTGTNLTSDTLTGAGLGQSGDESTIGSITPTFLLPDSAVSSTAGSNTDSYSSGSDVYFRLGTLQNTDNDTSFEYIVVEFNAIVDNSSGVGFDGNDSGEQLDNTFAVLENGTQIGATSNTSSVTVREPEIVDVQKSANPPSGADAGDLITYQVTFSNTGSTSAYDIDVTDILDAAYLDLQYTGTSDIEVRLDGALLTEGSDYTDSSSDGANRIDLLINQLASGSSIEVTYQAQLTTLVEPSQSVGNTASLTYTSLPGSGSPANPTGSTTGTAGTSLGERTGSGSGLNDYSDSNSATVTVNTPTLVKTISSTSRSDSGTGSGLDQHTPGDEDVAVGETITYHLTLTLQEGTTQDVRVVDLLPYAAAGGNTNGTLGIVSTRVASIGSGLVSGSGSDFSIGSSGSVSDSQGSDLIADRVEFDFGTIVASGNNVADDTIVIEVVARVEDVPATEAVDSLTNTASLSYTNASGGTSLVASSIDVDVIEPELIVTKLVDTGETDSDNADAGDVVTYTLSVRHTGDSTLPAYDIVISDTLSDPELSLVVGSVVVRRNGLDVTGSSSVTGNTAGDSTVLVGYSDAAGLGLTDQLTVTFQAQIATTASPTDVITNQIALSADNTPGTGGRTITDDSQETVTINANSISGYVFHDENNDGARNEAAGTHGIAGVTVLLSGTDHLGNPVGLLAVTNAQGQYTFSNLRPSDATGYTVTEIEPPGFLDGQDSAGSPFGGSTGTDGLSRDIISGVVISVDGEKDGTEYNFGELQQGSIEGSVYVDANYSGSREVTEDGISGTQVRLSGTDDLGNAVNITVTTNADGSYVFSGLRPSDASGYSVSQVTQPSGYMDGEETSGTLGGTVAAPSTTDQIDSIVLTPGDSGAAYLFGELLESSVAGSVYIDANNDGVRGGLEAGVGQVRVRLSGIDDRGNVVSQEVTTGSDGSYAFDSLRPSDATGYTLTQINSLAQSPGLTGLLDGKDSDGSLGSGDTSLNDVISSIVVGPDASATDYLFGEVEPAIVSGTVFEDIDNDGALDSGESGVAGVSMTLTGTDDLGAAVNQNAVTNSNGEFSFTNLRPGSYTLAESQPAGYLDGIDTTGSQGGTASNDLIAGFTLSSGQSGTGNLFAELSPSSLTGIVFDDTNADGTFNGSDAGIDGVTVRLTGTDDLGNTINITQTTSGGGLFQFGNLRPGSYSITETQPSTFLDGQDSDGSLANGDTSTDDAITSIEVEADQDGIDYRFAELQPSVIEGSVYLDNNQSGACESFEGGVAGVIITLTGTDDRGASVTRTVTTDPDGEYRFENVRPGTYTLTQTQPVDLIDAEETAGTEGGSVAVNDVIASIVIEPGDVASEYSFGEMTPGELEGTVFSDLDNDGFQDAGDLGIQGVLVTLTGTDDRGQTVNTTATTDLNGHYAFRMLRPGTYAISQSQPGAFLDGLDSDGTLANGDNSVNDTISSIEVVPNDTGAEYNFAELAPASLSGTVFDDQNNDGTQNGADAGIEGVTITLTGTDDLGNAVNRVVTTSGGGLYQFDNLRPGSYSLTESQPAVLLDGTDSDGSLSNGDDTADDVISSIEITAGQAGTGYMFAEIQPSTLSGYVYQDRDNDGSREAGEEGIAGINVRLQGTDDRGSSVDVTVQTNLSGRYEFSEVRPGDYTIAAAQSGAHLDGVDTIGTQGGTASNDLLTLTTFTPGTTGTENNFGELLASSLSGLVFNDHNNNGTQESGEDGIEGVTITLTGTNDLGESVVRTTSTDASGVFAIGGLRPSDSAGYTLTETQPAAFNDGSDTPGSLGGTTPANDVIRTIDVDADEFGTDYLFAERGVTVTGTVFRDDNRDGILTGSEIGLGGIEIELYDETGSTLLSSTTTLPDGSYRFDHLPAGNYQLRQVHPTQYTSTTNDIRSITVPLTGLNNQNFGETLWDLGDRIWYDSDANGIQDAGEQGLSGVDVTLVYAGSDNDFGSFGDNITRSTTTDGNGDYGFDNLYNGFYRVIVDTGDLPTGATVTDETDDAVFGPSADDSISRIEVDGGTLINPLATGDRFDVDFGYTGNLLVGDTVWYDVDGNGIQSGSEPGLAGINLTLAFAGADGVFLTADDLTLSTTTDAAGRYQFQNLFEGDHRIVLETADLPIGFTVSTTETDDAPFPSATADGTSELRLSSNRSDADFGFRGTGRIGDRIWFDADGDGTQTTGEPGLAGAVVQLEIDYDLDSIVDLVLTTTTDTSGDYEFTDLPAGLYSVVVTPPSGTAPTFDPDGIAAASANRSSFGLSSGEVVDDQDFGYRGTGSIGDTIFYDVNNNGTEDAGDRPLSGITVELELDQDGDGTVDYRTSTVTNSAGQYEFENLIAGDYTIQVDESSLIPGMRTGATFDPDGVATPHRTELALAANESRTDQDFGYHAAPNYRVRKDDGLSQARPGDVVTYTIMLDNIGTNDGRNVVLTDSFPTDVLTNVRADSGGTVDPLNGTVVWNFSNLNVGETVMVQVTADVINPVGLGIEDFTNRVTATDDGYNGADLDPTDNSDTDTDILIAQPDYSVVKTDGLTDVVPGQRITYEILVRNDGNQAGSGVIVEDSYPSTLLSNVTASHGGTVDPLTGNIAWSLGTLNAGESVLLTVEADVANPAPPLAELILNSVTVRDDGANGADPTPTNNSDNDSDNLIATPDYRITKSDDLTEVSPGDTMIYTITVENIGDQTGTGVIVTDTYPNGLIDILAVSGGGAIDPVRSEIIWNIGTLAGGDSVQFSVTARVHDTIPAGEDLVLNSVVVADDGTNGTDPTPTNNSDSDQDVLVAHPDLVISKSDNSTDAVSFDEVLVYTITYANVGDQDATGVIVTEDLPEAAVFVAAGSDPRWTQLPDGRLQLDIGDLATDESGAATVVVRIGNSIDSDDPRLINTVNITDDGLNGLDPTPSNNTFTLETPALAYAYDSFNDLSAGQKDLTLYNADDVGRGLSSEVGRAASPLPIDTVYTGIVDPGTTLTGKIYDQQGRLIGEQTVIADTAGNWLMQFPSTVISQRPYSMQLQQTPALYNASVSDNSGFNLRRYFHPAIHVQLYMNEPLSVAGAFRALPNRVLESMHHANENPLNFSMNSYSYELRMSSSNPAE